jgi:glycosyltransferase involved in cell wall biosynthesis
LNFLFHLRSDAFSKHGGDVSLGRQYKALLENAGHAVALTTDTGAFSGAFDAALTFNLDRPFESAQFVEQCVARRVPVLVYSLHHPPAGVASFLKAGASGGRGLLARLARFDPTRYESLLTLTKVLMGKFKTQRLGHLAWIDTARAQRFMLDNAALVLGSSALEIAQIQRSFPASAARFAVVPHILEALATAAAPTALAAPAPPVRDIDVLCAGRIESRKNQMMAAQLARKFPSAKFVFVGTPSPSEQRYFADFSAQIAGLSNVEYLPSVPIDQLRSLFDRSRVFLSLSWFEVVSLTELEAYSRGCQLLVGRNSYAAEFLGGRARQVDPGDGAAAAAALTDLLADTTAARPFDPGHPLYRMAPPQVLVAFERAFAALGSAR